MIDCLIVGVTFPGLALGALLARAGKRVLLLERRHEAGGRISPWQREGYVSLQGIPRFRYGEKGAFHRICSRLGLSVPLEPLNRAWILDTDDRTRRITLGRLGVLFSEFLSPWDRLRAWQILRTLKGENLEELEETSIEEWFVRNRVKQSLQKVLLALACECTHCADPAVVSAGETLRCFRGIFENRSYLSYPRKGWPDLLRQLQEAAESSGEIRWHARVESIEVREERVLGVRVDGEFVPARCVVAAIPCSQMVGLLPAGSSTPEYLRFCRKTVPSAALIVDLALTQRIFPAKGLWFFLDPPAFGTFLSNLSHLHAPAGKQLATFVCPCSPQDAARPEVIQTLEKKVEANIRKAIPGKETAVEWRRSQVVHMLDSIAIRADQTRKDRPGYRVPRIKGLFLVGDSTCAPGCCWEMEYESVLACFERILAAGG